MKQNFLTTFKMQKTSKIHEEEFKKKRQLYWNTIFAYLLAASANSLKSSVKRE